MELNDLLESMASEGSVESSGVFTLDHDYALRKLDDYRLPDPALFILNLVASAVLCGGHEFIVETENSETRVFFNGTLPEPQRLPELFSFILKPGPQARASSGLARAGAGIARSPRPSQRSAYQPEGGHPGRRLASPGQPGPPGGRTRSCRPNWGQSHRPTRGPQPLGSPAGNGADQFGPENS